MILSDRSIREELAAGRIEIDPLYDDCIQPSSVDLHIDRYFRVFRNHTMRVIDVKEPMEDLTELVEIKEEDHFVLHPGEFGLGSTHERVKLPADLVARLEGKSSRRRACSPLHRRCRLRMYGHLPSAPNVANLPIPYPGMKMQSSSFADTAATCLRAKQAAPVQGSGGRPHPLFENFQQNVWYSLWPKARRRRERAQRGRKPYSGGRAAQVYSGEVSDPWINWCEWRCSTGTVSFVRASSSSSRPIPALSLSALP